MFFNRLTLLVNNVLIEIAQTFVAGVQIEPKTGVRKEPKREELR